MKPEESQIPESMDKDVWGEATPKPTDEKPENLSPNTVLETVVPNSTAENPITDNTKTESVGQVLELQDNSASRQDVLYADALKRVRELKQEEANLKIEIAQLQATYKNLQTQINTTQTNLSNIVQESLAQLEQRKQALQISVEQLERRQERIRNEMRTTFAGASQDLAIRVQGFKDYLAGSLQDLAAAAEQLQLVPTVREREKPDAREKEVAKPAESQLNIPQIAQQQFPETTKQIRRLIDQYRNQPDYYGPAWQLRRTFEPVHAERVSNWFFNLGGRGALRTMGSRLQNILVASAAISILHKLYGDRLRTLILANTPERLGEWRRGLQDCLGIGRPDFGPDRGVTLFEAPVALAQRADRLTKANQMPLIIIDDSEEQINLALLQFPLWLAFAPDPKTLRERDFEDDF
jgi:predicted  nucleic acid-binding Zn-ribbon protein